MKAIRLKPALCSNPEFSRQKNRQRAEQGLTPLPVFLKCEPGEIVESVDAPQLCVGPDPALAPYDKECRDAVQALLEKPNRAQDRERLRQMWAKRDQLTADARKYVEAIYADVQDELADHDKAAEVDTPPGDDDE